MTFKITPYLSAMIALSFAQTAWAVCDVPIKTPLSFIGLYELEKIEGLEKINRIFDLCPKQEATCLEKNLQPTATYFNAYPTPEFTKPIIAFGIFYGTPSGLQATFMYLSMNSATQQEFTPDLYESDYGYGPYFDQTLLETRGDWHLVSLPGSYPIKTGWIYKPNSPIRTLEKNEIVTFNQKNYVILDVKKDAVVVREEQPDTDMACGNDPLPLKKFKPITLPFSEVYDNNCHLQMTVTYTRGC